MERQQFRCRFVSRSHRKKSSELLGRPPEVTGRTRRDPIKTPKELLGRFDEIRRRNFDRKHTLSKRAARTRARRRKAGQDSFRSKHVKEG